MNSRELIEHYKKLNEDLAIKKEYVLAIVNGNDNAPGLISKYYFDTQEEAEQKVEELEDDLEYYETPIIGYLQDGEYYDVVTDESLDWIEDDEFSELSEKLDNKDQFKKASHLLEIILNMNSTDKEKELARRDLKILIDKKGENKNGK